MNRPRPTRPPDRARGPALGLLRRPGFSLIESTIAVVLLVVALSTAVRTLSWIARDRLDLDRRTVALREADNLLDLLSTASPGPAEPPALSSEATLTLPGGSVEVDRRAESLDGVPLERITVTVRYDDRPGRPAPPVRLTTWVASSPDPALAPPAEEAAR